MNEQQESTTTPRTRNVTGAQIKSWACPMGPGATEEIEPLLRSHRKQGEEKLPWPIPSAYFPISHWYLLLAKLSRLSADVGACEP